MADPHATKWADAFAAARELRAERDSLAADLAAALAREEQLREKVELLCRCDAMRGYTCAGHRPLASAGDPAETTKETTCPECDGTGQVIVNISFHSPDDMGECERCGGTGSASVSATTEEPAGGTDE